MKRKQFTFYRSFYEAVMTLPPNRRHKVIMAIIEYGLDGVLPENLSPAQKAQFILAKPTLYAGRKRAKASLSCGKSQFSDGTVCNNKKEIEEEIENELEAEAEAEGFGLFWERYPRKVGRQEAQRVWARVGHEKDKILSALALWSRYSGWLEQGGRFVPKPAKWLAEGWYLQDPPGVIPTGASGVLGMAELEAIKEMLKE